MIIYIIAITISYIIAAISSYLGCCCTINIHTLKCVEIVCIYVYIEEKTVGKIFAFSLRMMPLRNLIPLLFSSNWCRVTPERRF